MELTYTLKAGCGYWDTTSYPYGGCFRRTAQPLAITAKRVVSTFKSGEPKEVEGECAGRNVVFLVENCQ